MEKNYSIEEILSAVDELQENKKEKNYTSIVFQKEKSNNNDVPSDTLKLIEEAERSIKSKMQSE